MIAKLQEYTITIVMQSNESSLNRLKEAKIQTHPWWKTISLMFARLRWHT